MGARMHKDGHLDVQGYTPCTSKVHPEMNTNFNSRERATRKPYILAQKGRRQQGSEQRRRGAALPGRAGPTGGLARSIPRGPGALSRGARAGSAGQRLQGHRIGHSLSAPRENVSTNCQLLRFFRTCRFCPVSSNLMSAQIVLSQPQLLLDISWEATLYLYVLYFKCSVCWKH